MSARSRRHGSKEGLPPGALVHVGERRAETVAIAAIRYDGERVDEHTCADLNEAARFVREGDGVVWINVDGIHDVAIIEQAREAFGIHPLVLADVLDTTQRTKFEDYDDYLFVVLKMLTGVEGEAFRAEQVSMIAGAGYVLSFQEEAGDVFDPLRRRIRENKGRIRRAGSDYLANCLIDAVLDGYFGVMEVLGERADALERRLVARPERELLAEIYRLRREAAFLRRCVWPLREAIGSLERSGSPLVEADTRPYLRDLHDHAVQIIDAMEMLRDTVGGMLEMYLSSASNRMNEVMRVLTVIATVFIPLTFIAGVYGMNFKNMPELDWPWAYPSVWVAFLIVAVGMFVYFRRKKWI